MLDHIAIKQKIWMFCCEFWICSKKIGPCRIFYHRRIIYEFCWFRFFTENVVMSKFAHPIVRSLLKLKRKLKRKSWFFSNVLPLAVSQHLMAACQCQNKSPAHFLLQIIAIFQSQFLKCGAKKDQMKKMKIFKRQFLNFLNAANQKIRGQSWNVW